MGIGVGAPRDDAALELRDVAVADLLLLAGRGTERAGRTADLVVLLQDRPLSSTCSPSGPGTALDSSAAGSSASGESSPCVIDSTALSASDATLSAADWTALVALPTVSSAD
ncbi:hypothetical protein NJ76_11045 [Rhodococcus sp. IITR03]|nr:hypothetical protein NJ76_11045 [Rhodococcus sp. IITR03]